MLESYKELISAKSKIKQLEREVEELQPSKDKIEKINVYLDEGAILPTRAHLADAGLDICTPQDIYVPALGRMTIDTGIHIELPKGYFADIRPKSGLLFNHNLTTAGTVDSGYTGAIRVRLINLSREPYSFKKGEKIAQMVILKCELPELNIVESLKNTERGGGGFGSTGK